MSREHAELAERLRVWRADLNLSLDRAADRFGVAPTTVRDWELGRRPRDASVSALQAVLGAQPSFAATPLRQARIAAGYSMQQAARRLGVSTSTVSMWERGKRRPGSKQIYELAWLLSASKPQVEEWLRHHPPSAPQTRNDAPLARVRRAAGFSLAEAAVRLGTSPSTLARIETGSRTPNLLECMRMAALYGRTVETVARSAGFVPSPLLDRKRWTPDSLGEVICALRKAHGETAAALARAVGVGRTTVRRWETGRFKPSRDAIRRLEDHYALRPGALPFIG